MSTTTLSEKMKRISGVGQKEVPTSEAEGDTSSKWDTMESGIENVYFLRNKRFETYFTSAERRPSHWPRVWLNPNVIWDSVGMLWAENDLSSMEEEESFEHVERDGGDSMIAGNAPGSMSEGEPLLPEMKAEVETKSEEAIFLQENNKHNDLKWRKRALIDRYVSRMQNDVPWDYLVVYFDQCLVEANPYAELPHQPLSPTVTDESPNQPAGHDESQEIVMGGFFDGVCTVSIRTPSLKLEQANDYDGQPYLAIGALATEKSLSEYENEKVSKSMIDAVVKLGQWIVKDVEEHQHKSVWHRAFVPLNANLKQAPVLKPEEMLVSIPLDVHPEDVEHTKINFWKNRLGFEEPSEAELSILTREHTFPFLSECEALNRGQEEGTLNPCPKPLPSSPVLQRTLSIASVEGMGIRDPMPCEKPDIIIAPTQPEPVMNGNQVKILVIRKG